MVESGEQEILAMFSALLALERNYLAEERTALAELRAGLSLALMAPPASTIIAYIFSILPIESIFLVDLLVYTFFAILTLMGAWMSLRSRSKLNDIRKKKKILNDRKSELIRRSKLVYDLMSDFIEFDRIQ